MRRTRAALAAATAMLFALVGVGFVAGVVFAPPAAAASLVEVTNFGDNPGGMRMHVYVPDSRPANANAADYALGTSKCTTGQLDLTPQAWGDKVRAAYPGYSGERPRVQLWHGTADTLVPYSRLNEEIEQWTNVFGLGQTPTATDTPQTNWNRRRYADASGTVQVEAYSIQGAGHSLPMSGMAQVAIGFFGLDRSTPGSPPASSSTPTSPSPSTPAPAGGCRVAYTVNAWNTGLTASITLTNTSTTTVNGWTLTFTLPGGQTITGGWNATYSPTSGAVSARNMSYDATIAPNASVGIGFQATHTGNTGRPAAFTLNGATCSNV